MNNPITVEFTAISTKDTSGSYKEVFEISSEQELIDAVAQFDNNVPSDKFRKYDMETYAVHNDGSDLTEQERTWFLALDEKETIGFIQ